MLEHLGGAEWRWFQGVVAGKQPELPGDVDDDRPPYDPMSVEPLQQHRDGQA